MNPTMKMKKMFLVSTGLMLASRFAMASGEAPCKALPSILCTSETVETFDCKISLNDDLLEAVGTGRATAAGMSEDGGGQGGYSNTQAKLKDGKVHDIRLEIASAGKQVGDHLDALFVAQLTDWTDAKSIDDPIELGDAQVELKPGELLDVTIKASSDSALTVHCVSNKSVQESAVFNSDGTLKQAH